MEHNEERKDWFDNFSRSYYTGSDCMKWMLIVFVLIAVFVLSSYDVEPLPRGTGLSVSISQREHWSALECGRCPYGYMCYFDIWYPSLETKNSIWIFGIYNSFQKGGILHFREYPDHPCKTSCIENIPILYTAEVVYVPPHSGSYDPEDVPLTYLPPGKYVVTSPSFAIQKDAKLWYFYDDGLGAKTMKATLQTDKVRYGTKDPHAVFYVQVERYTEYIRADSIFGEIILPDGTKRTVEKESWHWNETEKRHEFVWGFTNDKGCFSIPKEGPYIAEMIVKKKYFKDEKVSVDFEVCSHVGIDLDLNRDPPDYEVGAEVQMTVHVTDENGEPLSRNLESILVLPSGNEISTLLWTPVDVGTYVSFYSPQEIGRYHITVKVKDENVCYEGKNSAIFFVGCEEAFFNLEINNTVIDEPVEFVLTVEKSDGTLLSGGEIESDLHLPDGSILTLSWSDEGDGNYTTHYTPSELGHYRINGTVTVLGEGSCFRGSFSNGFTVVEEELLPDLVIRNEDIVVKAKRNNTEDSEPQLGDTVVISVTVWNLGVADTGEFYVYILMDGWIIYSEKIQGLAAGESKTFTCEWTFYNSGCFIISAVVDPNKEEIV